MIVQCVSPDEYRRLFPSPKYTYDSTAFSTLNQANAVKVLYVIGYYEPNRPLIGITVGFDGTRWRCPFSAPFGFPVYNRPLQLGDIYDFFTELSHMLGAEISVTLPATLHADNMWVKIAGSLNSLCRHRVDDFNFHFTLPMTRDTLDMSQAARRNVKRAIASGLELIQTDDISNVYNIIAEHHKAKGYRMAMTEEAVIKTADIVPTDFFTVKYDGADIAGVYVQRACPDTAQLINWGDMAEHSLLRPMNFMAVALAEHYSRLGLKHFDMGPASTAGIPNAGLCRFKEEIGCTMSLKPTFVI